MNLYPHFRLLHGQPTRSTWALELSFGNESKSWRVPHGPPSQPHTRHLAIERANGDADFTPEIGCWDAGPAEVRAWTARRVVVVLHGARVRGCFALIRIAPSPRAHWLWIRVNPRTHFDRSRPVASSHREIRP